MNMRSKSNWMRMFLSLLVLTAITACAVGNDSIPEPAQKAWTQNDLEQVVGNWRERSTAPGVVVGISLPDRSEIIITSGESEEGVTLRKDDQFRIASITKTFIAAEILRLAAEGKINLDDPLNAYLPETPHGHVVTVRHLLSHRSGYFDPVHDDPGFIPYIAEHLEKQWTWDEMLTITFQNDLFFPPGSDYRYSNANYMLLGLIIEKVAQQSLGEVLASDLIVPLSLDHTFYTTPATDTEQIDLVHGYLTHPLTGETVDSMTIPYATIVSASVDTMISNASDLLTWSRMLYGNESIVLEPAFKEQMLSFDDISPYGLGVFQFHTPIGISLGHGGDIAGYLSLMEYFSKQDMSMVILVNADTPSINLSELRDLLLAALFKADLDAGIKSLLADLKSEDASTRKDAIIALGHSGSNSEEAIEGLIAVLKEDSSAENRREAALALGLVGSNSDQARQALTDALNDEDSSVREGA
ncbi:MAG: serine hydrolase [Anaerolineae bacterium]|nr:serine hydrolase [Anaerolineae bacterium]